MPVSILAVSYGTIPVVYPLSKQAYPLHVNSRFSFPTPVFILTFKPLAFTLIKLLFFFSSSTPVYNWQATKTTVKERFAFMFNNEILCDVHFVVGRENTQQRIPAHKFVLSCGSAVFDAMFNGTLATQADEVELPDVEPAAFLALLRYTN